MLALGIAVAGCATQADLREQGRAFQGMIDQQSRSIEDLKHAIEGLRTEVEGKGRGPRAVPPVAQAPAPPPAGEEVTKLEKRLHELEHEKTRSKEIGMTLSPEGMSSAETAAAETTATTPGAAPATEPPRAGESPAGGVAPGEKEPPPQLAAVPPTPPPPPPVPIDASWKREVAQDQAVVSAMAVPERSEYLGALDSLAKGDCATAAPRLGTLAAGPKSPLSDNVLYWQARCAAARGDMKEAESKLEDVVTRYPRGDKAPAALLERGKLLIRTGDEASARMTLSKLIKEYPSTAEAAQARLKITEIER